MSLLLANLILATGLPPQTVMVDANVSCPGRSDKVRFTYRVDSGACAPGGPCSYTHENPDPNTSLVLRQNDCFWPQTVHFVRDGVCEGEPVWAVKGIVPRAPFRIEPWPGGQGLALQQDAKAPQSCPGPPKSQASIGPLAIAGTSSTWQMRALEDMTLEEQPDGLVVISTPAEQALAFEGAYRSQPIEREVAEAALAKMSVQYPRTEKTQVNVQSVFLGGEEVLRKVQNGSYPMCIASRDLDLALILDEHITLTVSGHQDIFVENSRCSGL
jgi:hypothetical protein